MTVDEIKNIILEDKLLNEVELNKAVDETKKLNRPLERLILDLHLLSKDVLYRAIGKRLGIEYKNLDNIEIPADLLKIYSEDLSRSTRSLPLFIKDGVLYIAMEDPTNVSLIDQVQLFTNYPIEVNISTPDEIEDTLNRIFLKQDGKNLFYEFQEIKGEGRAISEAVSIVKIVDLIVAQAVRDRASDIHIEPEEGELRVRFRIDGVMHEVPSPPKEWESSMVSRIKVLSGMDIAESRVPQDGHFQSKVDEKVVDFRVSTLPTIHGENVVMRLLDTASVTIGLERMGFTTYEDLKRYEELISRPYGIILSTGPTGSGKTTTLYSALMRINTPDINIITLEDPVEYRLGLIRQVQVNPKAGITFSNGLRAILRQDPDVIMVGEIRDLETARMAVQAALTGHLVFSTLHTNDAASAIARLVDMGVESFLLAASLIGVMAQRLVRCICPKCKEQYEPSKAVLKKWGLEGKKDLTVYRGKGCAECKNTGYKGRSGIFELMSVDDEMREMINKGVSAVELRNKAQKMGMRTLWEDGRAKVTKGFTTFEEVARVCEEQLGEKKLGVDVIEVKPYVDVPEEVARQRAAAARVIKVDPQSLADYKARMARWLSDKK